MWQLDLELGRSILPNAREEVDRSFRNVCRAGTLLNCPGRNTLKARKQISSKGDRASTFREARELYGVPLSKGENETALATGR